MGFGDGLGIFGVQEIKRVSSPNALDWPRDFHPLKKEGRVRFCGLRVLERGGDGLEG